MTAQARITAALNLARKGEFAEARNILELVEMGRRAPHDIARAWATFGKLWRGE